MPAEPKWSGAVRLEPGRLTFTGELGSAHAHAHAAVQVLLVDGGRVTLTDERGHATEVRAAIIPTGARHTLEADGATGATVYLDPSARVARALSALVDATGGDRRDSPVWSAAADALVAGGPVDLPATEQALTLLLGGVDPAQPRNPALRQALALLPELTGGPIRLGEVAAAVGLSPSRLRHLFVGELGLPFTSCVRWARLQAAMRAVQCGGNLTEAAHAAGFSDSAHLTRVFHAMFGLAPSAAARHLRWN